MTNTKLNRGLDNISKPLKFTKTKKVKANFRTISKEELDKRRNKNIKQVL